jgi:hypothetical protein
LPPRRPDLFSPPTSDARSKPHFAARPSVAVEAARKGTQCWPIYQAPAPRTARGLTLCSAVLGAVS